MRSFIWNPVYDIRVTSACAIFFLLAEALNRQVHSSRLPNGDRIEPFKRGTVEDSRGIIYNT